MYSTPEVNSLKTNAKHIILNPIIAYTQHSLSIANPRKMWSHLRERGQWLVYVVEWTFRGMWKGIRYHIRRHVGCHASSPQSQGPGALCYEEHFLHEVLDIGWRRRAWPRYRNGCAPRVARLIPLRLSARPGD